MPCYLTERSLRNARNILFPYRNSWLFPCFQTELLWDPQMQETLFALNVMESRMHRRAASMPFGSSGVHPPISPLYDEDSHIRPRKGRGNSSFGHKRLRKLGRKSPCLKTAAFMQCHSRFLFFLHNRSFLCPLQLPSPPQIPEHGGVSRLISRWVQPRGIVKWDIQVSGRQVRSQGELVSQGERV